MMVFLLSATILFTFNHFSISYPLNQTCSPPVGQGGVGYCGPSFCQNIPNIERTCVFSDRTYPSYTSQVASTRSKTCTQSTDARCQSSYLKGLMVGEGVKAAYCNDAFLVISADGSPGFADTLATIRNPPGSTDTTG
jgi:hypothetical protein